mmetsp:Transcript_79342/g.179039  ORF Transcript_79342/g.179039 Transcript_79342/m.179039 type:complete len:128 (+) Transcript_79342:65-448(+)
MRPMLARLAGSMACLAAALLTLQTQLASCDAAGFNAVAADGCGGVPQPGARGVCCHAGDAGCLEDAFSAMQARRASVQSQVLPEAIAPGFGPAAVPWQGYLTRAVNLALDYPVAFGVSAGVVLFCFL